MASIERLGLRNVLVRAKTLKDDEAQEIRQKSLGVSQRDASAIAEAVPASSWWRRASASIPTRCCRRPARATAPRPSASRPRHRELAHLALAEGRFLDPMDDATHAQVAVIGPAVRRDLFGYGPAVGEL